jgi:uncharacterized protein
MPLHALIIFVKNPIEGNVKTRLAKTVGHPKAVEVYRELLEYTRSVAQQLPSGSVARTVYYGDFVNGNDLWNGWEKALQPQGNLGERMKEAFREQFAKGHQRVLIIGSDCLELQPRHLEEAFKQLQTNEVVIGPSKDGGYYLLGMSQLHEALFDDMPWSQPQLLDKTKAALEEKKLGYTLLESLTDVDEWDDYLAAKAASSN